MQPEAAEGNQELQQLLDGQEYPDHLTQLPGGEVVAALEVVESVVGTRCAASGDATARCGSEATGTIGTTGTTPTVAEPEEGELGIGGVERHSHDQEAKRHLHLRFRGLRSERHNQVTIMTWSVSLTDPFQK